MKKGNLTIDPWGASSIDNYDKVFKEFGLKEFPENWKKKLNHYLFRRNIIIAHRDFDKIIERINANKPFIQITGIASSGRMHLGHKIDIDLFLFLKKFKAKNYFAIADIDGYVSRQKINTMDEAKKIAVDNLAHALALGLKTKDVYVQSKQKPFYYNLAFECSKKITENMYSAIYGHTDFGKISAVLLQIVDIIHPQLIEGKMPSVTGIGLEQDPHARITRDIAKRLPYTLEVPSFLYFLHQSGLQQGKKMSSSEPLTAIFLDDSSEEVKKKISTAFTGGKDTLEEQKRLGGRPDICKVYEIYKFHHPSNKFVEDIFKRCSSGKLLCGECKGLCIKFLTNFLEKHQERVKKTRKIAEKMVN